MPRFGDIRLTIRHLYLVVPIAGLAWAVSTPLQDNSFLWHVRAGTEQLDLGRVFTADPFSIEFAGDSWRTQSWLADILYGLLERTFDGIGWAPTYMFLVAALTVTLALATIYRRTEHLALTAAAGLLLTWQALPFANARPVVFSYALLAALVALLHSRRADWAAPPLIWLWAALHGSFVIGIGLLVLEGLRRSERRLIELAGVAAVLATLTAHGLGVWAVLLRFLGNREALGLINEWQPPNYSNPFMLPFGLLVLGAIYVASRGRLERRDLIVVLPFLFFGMLAVRNLYPAMLVVLPFVAGGLTPERAEIRRRESPVLIVAIGAALGVAALVGLLRPVELSVTKFPPRAAMEALDERALFHGIGPGGYLIYAAWPETPVLVDDRAELYGIDGFERYLDVADGKGWEPFFAELGITQALLDPDWPLTEALAVAGWNELYRDDDFVVAVAP